MRGLDTRDYFTEEQLEALKRYYLEQEAEDPGIFAEDDLNSISLPNLIIFSYTDEGDDYWEDCISDIHLEFDFSYIKHKVSHTRRLL